MPIETTLHPTLWRTCRVIANRNRLKIFRLLIDEPGLTVSAVAERLGVSVPAASEYLRALESRGLLTTRRVGRWVKYQCAGGGSESSGAVLATALRAAFREDNNALEAIFRAATAFTHPRRIEIYRAVQAGAVTLAQAQAATRIPAWALLRHFQKLETRGFITCQFGRYAVVSRPDALGQELVRIVGS
jgi:DNA-binding transcriptional ArsR family regulator